LSPTLAVGLIFALTYGLIVVFKHHKSQVLWGGVAVGILFGFIRAPHFVHDINWNVMGIFVGTLILSEYFILSRVPDAISIMLIRRTHTVGHAYLAVCIFASFLSIFIENVATVLIVAPIIIGIAIASNLQGAATLIGDPPSMILANYMRMNFNDFFFYKGNLGVFFAIQLGAVGSMLLLHAIYRRYRTPIRFTEKVQVRSYVPLVFLILMVLSLVCAVLVDPEFKWFGGAACMALGLLCPVFSRFAQRHEHTWVLRHYDWATTSFLAGIFLLVGMLERNGAIAALASWLSGGLGDNQLGAYLTVVWSSVGFSALIDNVPYLTAMIPVVQLLSDALGTGRELLVFGLLIGASLGGNITPVGAAANIVGVGILRKHDIHVSFGEFIRIGLPFTIVATALGSIFIYLVWR
jgi:Na+/H+ antiporter NhaD/arsenite permease-like protein